MSYITKIAHDLRVGQTVYLVDAKRAYCSKCGGITHWKHYVKTTKITGFSWYLDNKKNASLYYYCKQGKDDCCIIQDTIFTKRKDAEEECKLQQMKEK